MNLVKLVLENYRGYANYTINFSPGLNIIAGRNGIGKTTIVEAIAFVIFGNKMTRGKANTWIKTGEKHGKAILYLDDFIITRGDNEQHVQDLDGKIKARLNTGVDEWIQKHFGLTAELFTTANYIAQKDIESFSSLQSAERIKRVEKLLRIDVLNKIKQKAKEDITEFKKEIKSFKEKLSGVEYDESLFLGYTHLLKETEQELKVARAEQRELLVESGKEESKARDWETKKNLKIKTKDIIYKDIPYSLIELLDFQKKLNENKETQTKFNELEDVSPLDVSVQLEQKVSLYQDKNSEFKVIKDVKEICPTCEQVIPDAWILVNKRNALEKEMEILLKEGKDLRRIQTKFELLKKIHIDIPLDLPTVEQMIIDLPKLKELAQYEKLKNIKEPVIIDTSSIDETIDHLSGSIEINKKDIQLQETNKKLTEEYAKPLKQKEKELKVLEKFVIFIDKYRKEFSQNVIPLIDKNAKTIFNHLTENKFNSFGIDKDYSIEGYDIYSGSEGDSANFALRMSIAQVSRIKGFDIIILDEVAASFDLEKEALLLEILNKSTQQLIYVSHNEGLAKDKINA